jgi:hypothetical protein
VDGFFQNDKINHNDKNQQPITSNQQLTPFFWYNLFRLGFCRILKKRISRSCLN